MNNLAQIAQIMRGRNPQEIVLNMIKTQQINDPTIKQLINFAQSGDTNSLVNLATSICSQRGLDFNKEFEAFMTMLK